VNGRSKVTLAAVELIGSGLVLESRQHGPQLCLGPIAASYPPMGGGPAITNWDWSQVSGQESYAGTTWGVYTLIGTYVDRAFTMTRPPVEGYEPEDEADADLDPFTTPCPPPPGGWRVIDSARTTEETLERTIAVAEALPGYASLWLDQSINPAAGVDEDDVRWAMNDPKKLILNVAVTDDVAGAEALLRTTWGGPLCVSATGHTKEELRRVRDALEDEVEMLSSGTRQDRVHLEVVYDDGTLQRALDERYPGGVVVINSALRPYRPRAV
jgi:hypothetical protein